MAMNMILIIPQEHGRPALRTYTLDFQEYKRRGTEYLAKLVAEIKNANQGEVYRTALHYSRANHEKIVYYMVNQGAMATDIQHEGLYAKSNVFVPNVTDPDTPYLATLYFDKKRFLNENEMYAKAFAQHVKSIMGSDVKVHPMYSQWMTGGDKEIITALIAAGIMASEDEQVEWSRQQQIYKISSQRSPFGGA